MNKIILFITSIVVFLIASPVLAATKVATPSATPTDASITPSQTQDIQEKIKTLVKENLSATESTLQEKINQQTLVGYVGQIQAINSGNISINTKDGTVLQITTDEKNIITKAGVNIKLSSLAISDKVIVIGTLLKKDIILSKKILVIPDEPVLIISGTIVAKISSVDVKKKLVGLTIDGKEVLYGLTKKSTVKIDELKPGTTIFAITKKFDGKNLLSRAKIL
ncbi:MAG: hypothetical protein AAB965_00835 [Patescibacteria group bacterium]